MSEKRFFKSNYTEHILDSVTDKCYPIRDVDGVDDLIGLLNELDTKCSQLSTENRQLKQDKKLLIQTLKDEYDNYTKLMEDCAKDEFWQGYRGFQEERAVISKIVRKAGIDLE